MCQTALFKSETCPHRWLTITKACTPSANFSTQPFHHFKPSHSVFGRTRSIPATANTCPSCDFEGEYDADTTRMVVEKGQQGTLGNGYDLTDGWGRTVLPVGWGGYWGYGGQGYGYGYGYARPAAGCVIARAPRRRPMRVAGEEGGCGVQCSVM